MQAKNDDIFDYKCGWFKVPNKIFESPIADNEGLLKVYLWCLRRENHKDMVVDFKTGKGSIKINVCAGQFIFGRKSAAQELKMKTSTLQDRMKKLEQLGAISIASLPQYSIVSLLKGSVTQPVTQPVTQKDTESVTQNTPENQINSGSSEDEKNNSVTQKTDGSVTQPVTQPVTVKILKNNNPPIVPPTEKKIGYADDVLLLEREYLKLIEKYGEKDTARVIATLNNYKLSNGKKYKSDYHAILSWVVERVIGIGNGQPKTKKGW